MKDEQPDSPKNVNHLYLLPFKKIKLKKLHAPPFNLNPDLTSLRVNVTDNVNNKVMMYTMRF